MIEESGVEITTANLGTPQGKVEVLEVVTVESNLTYSQYGYATKRLFSETPHLSVASATWIGSNFRNESSVARPSHFVSNE
jgi:hypothetical protein